MYNIMRKQSGQVSSILLDFPIKLTMILYCTVVVANQYKLIIIRQY